MAIDRFDQIPISTGEPDPERDVDEAAGKTDQGDASGRPERRTASSERKKGGDGRRSLPRRTAPDKQRKPGRFRLFIWLLAPLLLIGLYGVGGYFLVPVLIKGPLAGMLSERLERPVRVKRVVFAPFTLNLYLHEIVVGAVRGGVGTEDNLIACEAARCRLGLERIYQGRLRCGEITLEQLNMHIRRDADGFNDLFDVLNIFSIQLSRDIDSVWPSRFDAGELTVHNGTVVVRDELIGRQYLIEQVELYLPPAGPDSEGRERLPEISAVVNGSPVKAEAVRVPDQEGMEETSLALHVREVVLNRYLDAFSHGEGHYQLTDGLADLDLKMVFPRHRDAGGRFILSGEAAVADLKISEAEAGPVFAVPEARLDFEYVPSVGELLFPNVVLSKPELTVTRKDRKVGGQHDPAVALFFDATDSYFLSGGRFRVERLRSDGGTVRFASPARIWSEVAFSLDGPAPGKAGEGANTADSASFSFAAVDSGDGKAARLAAEGGIQRGGGGSGRFSAAGIDVRSYQDILSLIGLDLDRGVGSIDFAYDFKPGNDSDSALNGAALHLREGRLDISDFAFSAGRKKIATGKNLRCDNLQTDGSARRSTCDTLTLKDSEIFSTPLLPALTASGSRKRQSQFTVNNLRVSGSRLYVPLPASLCSDGGGLVFNNVSLQADNLGKADSGGHNITGSAAIGAKGDVQVSGGYSAVGGQGSLQLGMRHVSFDLINPCLAPIIVPPVKQGTLHLQGDVSLPAGEFSGQAWMSDMEAGGLDGPRVTWQLASSDRVVLRFNPPHLDLGEIMIRKPSVSAGLIEPEGPLRNFFRSGSPSFDRVAIDRISIEDGRFALPWPIILPGYQPEVTGLDGTVSQVGQGAMPFAFKGRINGVGDFVLDGTAESGSVRSYSLEMGDVRLTPFTEFFRHDVGLAVDNARAAWKQTMRRRDDRTEVFADLVIRDGLPRPDAPFHPVLALLIDEKKQLRMTVQESLSAGEERPLLFQLVQRHLRHQAVRADISKQLVLKEQLPPLQLPDRVSFAPGSAVPDDPDALAGYRELLAKRPFVRLRLQPFISGGLDGKELQAILQQEADQQREEENRRRELEKIQREQREMERLAAIKEGRVMVETEEIDPEELTADLDPLPYVRVEVTEEMLVDLGRKRMHAVRDYLVNRLAIDPERVGGSERSDSGEPQVKIIVDPFIPGENRERTTNDDG